MGIVVREAEEKDAEAINAIFHATYGDTYAYPNYYDPQFIKKLIYANDSVMVVAEESETGKVLGTASVLEERGALSDLAGEFGRLAVHPEARGKGVGHKLMEGRIQRIQDRLQVGIVDARTTHPFSMKIAHSHGFTCVGYLPGKVRTDKRESIALMMQHFGSAISLRRNHPRVIPAAYQVGVHALENCHLDVDLVVIDNAVAYPLEDGFKLESLTTKGYSQLLRIERGRLRNREIFGSLQLHYGLFKLQAKHSNYLMAYDGKTLLGAIGFTIDEYEKTAFLFELISLNDNAIRFLLEKLLHKCEHEYKIEYLEVDVSAYAPRMQQTLLESGFIPAAYLPARVFHEVERLDVLKMVRLFTDALDQDQFDHLIEPIRPIASFVTRTLSAHSATPVIVKAIQKSKFFDGLNDEQIKTIASYCSMGTYQGDKEVFVVNQEDLAISIVSSGKVMIVSPTENRVITTILPGECFGEISALTGDSHSVTARTAEPSELIHLKQEELEQLIKQRPDIGVILYRNLALGLGEKLSRANVSLSSQ